MRYICLDCGEIFEEPHTYSENMGEFWGQPAYEEFADCPNCGGGYIELTDEMEDVYNIAYDNGVSSQTSKIKTAIRLLEDFVDCSKLSGDTVMSMIKELVYNEKNVAELVREHRNK